MADKYRIPSAEEKQLGQELIGKKITIFWDGDNVFYPCIVTEYDATNDKFGVVYEENSTGEKYTEDLKSSAWKIWAGTDAEYATEWENKVTPLFCFKTMEILYLIFSIQFYIFWAAT